MKKMSIKLEIIMSLDFVYIANRYLYYQKKNKNFIYHNIS